MKINFDSLRIKAMHDANYVANKAELLMDEDYPQEWEKEELRNAIDTLLGDVFLIAACSSENEIISDVQGHVSPNFLQGL